MNRLSRCDGHLKRCFVRNHSRYKSFFLPGSGLRRQRHRYDGNDRWPVKDSSIPRDGRWGGYLAALIRSVGNGQRPWEPDSGHWCGDRAGRTRAPSAGSGRSGLVSRLAGPARGSGGRDAGGGACCAGPGGTTRLIARTLSRGIPHFQPNVGPDRQYPDDTEPGK